MIKVIGDTKVPVKIWASDLETEAEQQSRNLASLPFIYKHVALMPDAHAGKGSTVGSVIATKGAIVPAAVGVDIGCGMAALKLPFKVDVLGGDEDLKRLRNSIERSIPVGQNRNHKMSETAATAFNGLGPCPAHAKGIIEDRVVNNAAHSVGTLGGGNHFIEVCHDEHGDAWLMLHSGSRNIGKSVAEIHIAKAKGLMKSYFIDLPDPDLAYLVQGTPEFQAYIDDLLWAQNFAYINRQEMLTRALRDISFQVYKDNRLLSHNPEVLVNCHHNYTGMENHFGENVWITRKGAVSAKPGQLGIIPGSMGTRSYIVEGLGNADSFCSCSHGAGRKMSRTKARATFTNEDLIKQTEGVNCRKDDGVLDEIPGAYKDIDIVMANQADLVKPLYTLKQILCVKG